MQWGWGLPGLFLQQLEVYVPLEAQGQFPLMLMRLMLRKCKSRGDSRSNPCGEGASQPAEEGQRSKYSNMTDLFGRVLFPHGLACFMCFSVSGFCHSFPAFSPLFNAGSVSSWVGGHGKGRERPKRFLSCFVDCDTFLSLPHPHVSSCLVVFLLADTWLQAAFL